MTTRASLASSNGGRAVPTTIGRNLIRRHFRSCGANTMTFLRRRRDITKSFLKKSWRGDLDEKPKVVIQGTPKRTPSQHLGHLVTALVFVTLGRVWRQCWAHFVAIFSTVTLAYLNIAGYFVGNDLQGSPSDDFQALYRLCLQVTAKLLVLYDIRPAIQTIKLNYGIGISDCCFPRDHLPRHHANSSALRS